MKRRYLSIAPRGSEADFVHGTLDGAMARGWVDVEPYVPRHWQGRALGVGKRAVVGNTGQKGRVGVVRA